MGIISADRASAWQFIRFLLVGVLNTAFGYVVYAIGVLAGLYPEAALAIAFVCGVLFNYVTTGRLVFRSGRAHAFPRFVVVYIALYGINVLALRLIIGMGAGPLLAQALVVPPIVLCTFVLLKLVVYRN